MLNNQKGLTQLFIVGLLLVGIGVVVYLIQFTQVFRPKASENLISKITEENYETTLNPWGDPWGWKKSPNPNIPIALSAPTQYWKSTDSNGNILEQQAQFIAKSNAPFLYFDSYEPHVEGQNPKSIALLNRIKQLNPNIKALGYFVQWEPGPGYDDVLQGANNGNPTYESFFVHKKNKPANKDNRLYGRPDHPEWGFSPLMDITNSNYRAYIIPKIVENIRSAKMDGLMNDLLFYNYTDYYNNPPSSMPDNYMPDNIKSSWPGGMVAFIQELKVAMGSELYLFGNVNDDQTQFMQNDLLSAGRLDGVIFEDPFNSRPSPDAISKVNNLMNIVDSFGKKSIMVVSGAHNGTPHTGSTENQEKAAHMYFFTAYLMTLRSANHMLLYYHPTSIFFQYNSEAFFKAWDLNIGNATSDPQNIGNGVYVRKFQKAYVYWNPTFNNYTIPEGRDLYNIDNGQEIAGQIVSANSGSIFVTSDLLAEYNRPPDTTITQPSPSPGVPGAFTLNPPETFCSGTASYIKLRWTASPNGPQPGVNSGYFVYVDGVYQYNNLSNLELIDPTPKNYGQTYKYKIEAVMIPEGRIFSDEKSVVAQNCSTVASPSPSPSMVGKIGDIDKNGKVDIFDFNIFVGDYPLKNLRSDFNHDGMVNIFDFNLLITYFGK